MNRLLRILFFRWISGPRRAGHLAVGVALAGAVWGLAGISGVAVAAPGDFPRPASLERDVSFWARIYSEVGTDAGLIHDTHNLSLIYEVVQLPDGLSYRARERFTEKRKKHFKKILLKLAAGRRSGLSREEKRILALFGPGVKNATIKKSASRLRFQLGQADKFRAGVIRSGAYRPHIERTLRDMNLPSEIANLPHVESSYTPTVYSRVGAAGLWQFTRSTGRRFMQVDHIVDERLDPYRASIAAARLLEQNYRVTGSWPLAITAYNHGAAGMRRAARKLGTKDITTVVRKYRSRTFGFASRNFYVEFLAATEVSENAERYFGPLVRDTPIDFETAKLPYYTKASQLSRALGIDRDALEAANPALRPTVWREAKYIPKGFEVRVPRDLLPKPLAEGVQALPKAQRYARQIRDTTYTVRRGDTLSTIARKQGVKMSQLVALNGLRSKNRIRVGQKLKLPTNARGSRAASPQTAAKTKAKPPSKRASKKASSGVVAASLPSDGLYTVRAGDNLTRIAERYGISVKDLIAMNSLRSRNRLAIGQRIRVGKAPVQTAAVAREQAPALKAAEAKPPAPKPVPAEVREPAPSPPPASISPTTPALASEVDTAAQDESPTEPSPGLLADPSDYTVASNKTILVQTGETLGHYAEWLGLRASRLRKINGMSFGTPVVVQQRLRLDFSKVSAEDFERIRVEYHRALQEEFFARWEIEGTLTHRVGRGDSLWILSTRKYDVPIWLLRQYNPDIDLDALSAGTPLTIPKLRKRAA